ncbi:MAG: PadR family transcriptional regulator [Spirochaetes bacterium GWB1_59_5]|nr:MAG: PadR family transcriptional regulator [Spirochaetes bacterium GWB1_59_5]
MERHETKQLMKDYFLGFIKMHILYHTGKRPFYGQELKEELEEHGYSLSFGTLYPLLHKLCDDGYLDREERNVEGKIRKYYSLTGEGSVLLGQVREKLKELVEEVME